jgi:glycosyltransferase involved in cell wall biosynthesis
VRICHVTPHLPPDQAANALLPFHLGCWAREAGDEPFFIAHPPRLAGAGTASVGLPGPVALVPLHHAGSSLARVLKIGSVAAAWRIAQIAKPIIASADIVHVHSNGLLAEYCARLAVRAHKPVVLTLYGTEIWHYRRKRVGPDLFTAAYRTASAVTFYSRGLLDHGVGLGLDRPSLHVVYPPIANEFQAADGAAQAAARAQLGIAARHLLLNVKRLHPLAGQRFLVEAMPAILAAQPDTELVICGTGALAAELTALARNLGVDRHVRLAGLVDNATVAVYNRAADLFVLPSRLEACPTVALEALACGTRVVSSDNPGGVELHQLFGDDVAVVPREDPARLAGAIVAALGEPRRTRPGTAETLERQFRPKAVAARYYSIYDAVLRPASSGRVDRTGDGRARPDRANRHDR